MWIVQSARTIKTWRCAVLSVRSATVRCCPLHLSQSPSCDCISRPHTSRSTQQATTALARSVPTSTTRTALIASRHRRHTYSSTATHLHLLSPRDSLVPASHATFSVARRIHGPRWYHEWCGPEEDGDRGQERAGAPAILRVACGVQACAIGHSCSGAPSMRSYRGR